MRAIPIAALALLAAAVTCLLLCGLVLAHRIYRARQPGRPQQRRVPSAAQVRIASERLADLNARRRALDPDATLGHRLGHFWAGDQREASAGNYDPNQPFDTDHDSSFWNWRRRR